MAPANQLYQKDEKVLCFHHELLYEAKVLETRLSDVTDKKSPHEYRVHYKGWKNTWDDWVPQDRLRKLTDENRELAQNLKRELDATRRPPPKSASTSKRRAQGSDIGSGRGSEERHSSLPAGGRGTKRNRDYEIEKVGSFSSPGTVPTSPSAGRSKDTAPSLGPYFRPFLTGTGRGRYQVTQPSADGAALRPQRSRYFQDDTDNEPTWKKKKVCDMTAEEILSGLPPDPPDLVTKRWAPLLSGTVAECYGGPPDDTKPTPQPMQQVNQDPGNESRRLFFQDHKPGEVLMIAGRPYPQPLHPLHSPVNEPDNDNFVFTQEENFHSRPSVRIVVPDIIKAHLVDDWENVTKNLQLVPLPSQAPVNFIMDTYFDEEKGKRRLGSAEADLLEEVVAGVKEYFDLTLGRILLYRFEREQFSEIRKLWEGGDPKWEGKGPGDAYGAEHLSRLFVTMPELIAQTNMDQQSVNRLREELSKMTTWLGKNSQRFFLGQYENASQEYIDKARGGAA